MVSVGKFKKERLNSGVSSEIAFTPAGLVMLYDLAKARLKLNASYRGPLVVTGLAGLHNKSYDVRHVNGQRIIYSYDGDQLKPFRLSERYLITGKMQKI